MTHLDDGATDRVDSLTGSVMWELSVDLLAVADQRGYFVAVSPSWERVTGRSCDEMTSRPYIDFVHPDDVESTIATARLLQEPGRVTVGFENRYRHVDGSYRWLEWSVSVPEDGSALYCIARDVTDLKTALAAVEGAALYTRTLIEASLDPLMTIGADGLIMDVNAAATSATGVSRSELIGSDFADWFTDSSSARTAYERTFEVGSVVGHPLAIAHSGGTVIDVVLNANLYRDADGCILGVFAAARDVSELHSAKEALDRATEFRRAMEYSASGMCLSAPDGRFIHVNSALCEMLGYPADELTRTTWLALTHPDDLDDDLREAQSLLSGERDRYRMLKRFVTSSGEVMWGDMSVGAVRDANGIVLHLVAQIADVTGRMLAEQALAERERLLQIVLDNAPETAMRLDSDLRVQYVNKRAVDVSGIPFDRWIGKTLQELGYPPELTRRWDGYHRHVFETGESVRYEFEIDNVDGHRWYESRSVAEFGPDGTVSHLVATSRDITDHKIAEQQLMRLATHDPLTGLANRAALSEEITRALAVGRRAQKVTGLLMIDLDRFKNVNDSLGHGVGDALLQAASDRLVTTVRAGDLVARPGGDEFMVVMRDLDSPSDVVLAAWRIVEAFREPFAFLGAEMFATASVGVAIASVDSKADDLIREADTALYVAKDEGRDRVSVFNEDLRAEVMARLTIEGELRHALGRGQLEVWYQPEVELATGRVIAVEALLRWRHPDGEVRPAGGFIEVAEETGLILDIGEWVLRQGFADAAHWAAEASPGRALTVRVNVSALQLAEPSLLESIDTALALTGADPSQLCIEITETALLRETSASRDNLAGIRSRGIQIAADDFGTGFASLAYLLQYPVDVLKIDRSFVEGITTDDQSRRLVAGIISLADALGMTVTAEGVERADQASMLRSLNCPGAQGYLFSPAVRADRIPAFLLEPFEPAEPSPGG